MYFFRIYRFIFWIYRFKYFIYDPPFLKYIDLINLWSTNFPKFERQRKNISKRLLSRFVFVSSSKPACIADPPRGHNTSACGSTLRKGTCSCGKAEFADPVFQRFAARFEDGKCCVFQFSDKLLHIRTWRNSSKAPKPPKSDRNSSLI